MIQADEWNNVKAQLENQSQTINSMEEKLQALFKVSSIQSQRMDQLFDIISKQSSQIRAHDQHIEQILSQHQVQLQKQSELIDATSSKIQKLEEMATLQSDSWNRNVHYLSQELKSIATQLREQKELVITSYRHLQELTQIVESLHKHDTKLKDLVPMGNTHSDSLTSTNASDKQGSCNFSNEYELTEIERKIEVYRRLH